jgi:hypothetical protein
MVEVSGATSSVGVAHILRHKHLTTTNGYPGMPWWRR